MNSPRILRRIFLLCFLIVGIRVAAQPAAPATDGDLFNSNRVIKVQITLAPADWDKLRQQERDMKAEFSKARLERLAANPYTWFSGDVMIDGIQFTSVGVRKRGFFGSADKTRPSLNIELNHFVKGRQFSGRNNLKLHNNKQDGTSLRQSLAYSLFSAAGVPAPRCNLAHVTVNGADLGVYSNLEGIDDAFLKRHFGSDTGNLYEAQISDFRPGWTRTFEKKNNKAASREDLDAVVKALQGDDAQLPERLGRLIDLDAFLNFWAMEVLINHWDGFSGDLNNTFVYHDPKTDKLRFIPWGADSTFGLHHVFVPFEPPASVWAVSFLTRRLYNHPVTQQKYRARLQELLTKVWDEKHLLAEVERMEKLTQGLSKVPSYQSGPELAQVKKFIGERRNLVESELKKPAEPWNHPMRRELYLTVVGKISAEFSTSWVPSIFAPAPEGAKARVKLDFYGRQLAGDFTEVKAMPDMSNPRNATIWLSGSFEGVELPIAIWVSTSTNLFQKGTALKAGESNNVMVLLAGQGGQPDFRILGSWESGPIQLDEVEMKEGSKIQGSIQAEISTIPWEDFDLTKLKKYRK